MSDEKPNSPTETAIGILDGRKSSRARIRDSRCLPGVGFSQDTAILASQTLRNLFKGAVATSPGIQTVAPTFIPLSAYPEFLPAWPGYLGKHAGVLVRSSVRAMQLYKHLRKIFIVQDEQGQEHFFSIL